MCHLYAFLANEPTKVECNLVAAQNARLARQKNGDAPRPDGWGIVCYDAEQRWPCPRLVKRVNAAINNHVTFSKLAESTYSRAVVAHVRHATVGSSSTLNVHPFTYDEWTFAHHGTVVGFAEIAPTLESSLSEPFANSRLGDSDSELLFLFLLSRLEAVGFKSATIPSHAELATRTLADAIHELAHRAEKPNRPPTLNFVLTNGKFLFACRWNKPLYLLTRDGIHACELCGAPHIRHDQDVHYRAVVVASEPISKETWTELPNQSLCYVSPTLVCQVHTVGASHPERVKT